MTNLLISLIKGFQALRKQIQSCQGKINAKWKAGKDLTESDEECVVDALEKISDYKRGLGRMNEKDKGVIQKL